MRCSRLCRLCHLYASPYNRMPTVEPRISALTLRLIDCSQSLSFNIPALLIRISSPSNTSIIFSNVFFKSSAFVMSQVKKTTRLFPNSFSKVDVAFWPFDVGKSTATLFAPLRSNISAYIAYSSSRTSDHYSFILYVVYYLCSLQWNVRYEDFNESTI